MMLVFRKLWMENLQRFAYLMNAQKEAVYKKQKLLGCFGMLFLCGIAAFVLFHSWYLRIVFACLGAMLGSKLPWLALQVRHTAISNQIVDAIPVWISTIYALIGENNIHNAILLSRRDAPAVLHDDLDAFITKIEEDHGDKDAYLSFLQQYQIDGFQDIMMKLYEFRSLSKDKLRYEIASLHQAIGKIEQLKRDRRYHKELFFADTLTLVMMSVPCVYMFFISLILSQLLMS